MTGVGKTAIALLLAYSIAELDKFGDLECESGKVLYLVGENPDDIQMRWIGMGYHYGFDERDAEVYFIPGVFDIEAMRVRIAADRSRR